MALETVAGTRLHGEGSRTRLRRHWPVLLILIGNLVLGGAVSLLNPLFESTDEIRHYRYIRYLVVEHALPVQGAEAVRSQSHHPPLYYLLSALASGWLSSPHTPAYEQPINPFWGYRNWDVGVDNKLQYLHSAAERFPFRDGYLAALVPRWINVLLGAATVWLTYRLGLRVWRGRPGLALGAAALVGFNPQFIYLSGAMNNDIIAAATGTAVLLVAVELVQEGFTRGRSVRLGLLFGLALLAKFHLIALAGIIALALWLSIRFARREPAPRQPAFGRRALLRRWLSGLGIVFGAAGLLAGWWFLRNWQLYGDPTALNKVNELWQGRPALGSWWALKQGLPYLWSSLWGRFGYGQIPLPDAIYRGLLIFCAFGLAGYLVSPWVRPRPATERRHLASLLLLAGTVAGFMVVVVYYILTQPAGPMGRFLFPALPAFSVLLVGGLDGWLPQQWGRTAVAAPVIIGAAVLAVVALGGTLFPAVGYPARAPVRPSGRALDVQVGDVARIRAVEVQPTTLAPGEPLFVSVVWEPLRQTERLLTVYVHVIDATDVLIAQRDTWPGLGRAPTTSWRVGLPFVDTYRVDLPETAYAPNRVAVRVGLDDPATGRLPVVGPGQPVAGDGIDVGAASIEARPGPWPNALQANFGDAIRLVGYALEPRALSAGETFTLTLYWQPHEERPLEHDYWVFAQVIDPNWQVWGSRDGAGPGWSQGQVVEDVRRITLLPNTPPGSYPVQVGLFSGETGRLPVLAPDGHYLDERVLLGPVRVRE